MKKFILTLAFIWIIPQNLSTYAIKDNKLHVEVEDRIYGCDQEIITIISVAVVFKNGIQIDNFDITTRVNKGFLSFGIWKNHFIINSILDRRYGQDFPNSQPEESLEQIT